MTIHPQIDALEALARIDAELKDLNDALTQEREALRGKQSHLAGLDERLERSKKSTEEMERTRNDLMGELRQMSMQIERSREKLSRCRTEREANAAQRELEEGQVFGHVQVGRDAELVPIDRQEIRALASRIEGRSPSARVVPDPRTFDFDDVRPEVAEDHGGERSGEDP